jgi:PPOX class probable FMN-dependent enzyme
MLAAEDTIMGVGGFDHVVSSEERLRAVLGHPSERARGKERARLDEHCRRFIAHSPFLILGTAGADGRCDVSPKGDHPGFVRVLDDQHLVIPDRLGNARLDGMRNILANAHIGLIFLIPGRDDTLRINGRAWIVEDATLLDAMIVQGKRPPFAIGVEVEEVFMHCPRAFMRAGLWKPERWPDASAVPSMAAMLWDQLPTRPDFASAEAYEADQRARLQTLY